VIDTQIYLNSVSQLLESRRQALYGAIARKMDVLNTRLQARIQGGKLSGQVLHQRSGKLKRSVEVIPATINMANGTVTGGVSGAGGPAFYGRFHEFGTENSYPILPVTKQALRFIIGNKVIFAKRVLHPPIEQRSFMRSAQTEMTPIVREELQLTVYDVLSFA